jgi:hypothetical protein
MMCVDNNPQYPAINHLVRRRKIVNEASNEEAASKQVVSWEGLPNW